MGVCGALVALCLLGVGCAADADKAGEVVDGEPDIEVPGIGLDFGTVALRRPPLTQAVRIANRGTDYLEISAITWEGSSAFVLDVASALPFILSPGRELELTVTFSAEEAGTFEGSVQVVSDSPGEELVVLPVIGRARLGPWLVVTPELQEVDIPIPCPGAMDWVLRNAGDDTVVVSLLSLQSSWFTLSDPPQTPFSLEPMEALTVEAVAGISAAGSEEALLTVVSNDVDSPSEARAEVGMAWEGILTARAEVPERPTLSVLLVVDGSPSMAQRLTELEAQALPLLEALTAQGADWRLGVTTRDDGCTVGPVITASTPDPVAAFISGLHGPSGVLSEALMEIGKRAISHAIPGGCNADLLAPGGQLHLAMVSDVADQSPDLWSDYLAGWRLSVSSDPQVTVSAFVDVDFSCGDLSGAGAYFFAPGQTGGLLVDICQPGWEEQLVHLASLPAVHTGVLPVLSPFVDASSMTVTADGLPAVGWTWDPTRRLVRVEPPPYGAELIARYLGTGGCL